MLCNRRRRHQCRTKQLKHKSHFVQLLNLLVVAMAISNDNNVVSFGPIPNVNHLRKVPQKPAAGCWMELAHICITYSIGLCVSERGGGRMGIPSLKPIECSAWSWRTFRTSLIIISSEILEYSLSLPIWMDAAMHGNFEWDEGFVCSERLGIQRNAFAETVNWASFTRNRRKEYVNLRFTLQQ